VHERLLSVVVGEGIDHEDGAVEASGLKSSL